MRVKLDEAIMWGKGQDRRRYEAGSVIEVEPEVAEQNKFMKETNDPLSEAPAPKAVKGEPAKPNGDK